MDLVSYFVPLQIFCLESSDILTPSNSWMAISKVSSLVCSNMFETEPCRIQSSTNELMIEKTLGQ